MTDNSTTSTNILLARLNALKSSRSASFEIASIDNQEWVAQLEAVASRLSARIEVSLAASGLHSVLESTRNESWWKLFRIASRLINEIELDTLSKSECPASRDQIFGPGAVYDFFKALSEIIQSSKKRLFIADPYMDREIFDIYLASANPAASCRLLIRNQAANVKAAADAFIKQHGRTIEVRKSHELHDRVIFVDDLECWIVGQSIKDAATTKPTYLAPLSPDVSQLKLKFYEAIWNRATPI